MVMRHGCFQEDVTSTRNKVHEDRKREQYAVRPSQNGSERIQRLSIWTRSMLVGRIYTFRAWKKSVQKFQDGGQRLVRPRRLETNPQVVMKANLITNEYIILIYLKGKLYNQNRKAHHHSKKIKIIKRFRININKSMVIIN